MFYILAAWGIDEHGAALVIFFFPVQLLQQFIQLFQDISGQHVAKSAQKVWDFFIVIHIHVLSLKLNNKMILEKNGGRGLDAMGSQYGSQDQ